MPRWFFRGKRRYRAKVLATVAILAILILVLIRLLRTITGMHL